MWPLFGLSLDELSRTEKVLCDERVLQQERERKELKRKKEKN